MDKPTIWGQITINTLEEPVMIYQSVPFYIFSSHATVLQIVSNVITVMSGNKKIDNYYVSGIEKPDGFKQIEYNASSHTMVISVEVEDLPVIPPSGNIPFTVTVDGVEYVQNFVYCKA